MAATGTSPDTIGLSALLHPASRGGEAAAKAARDLADLGFDVTGVGHVSLTLSLSRAEFERLFGRAPAAAGTAPDELPVPAAMTPWVASLAEGTAPERFDPSSPGGSG